MLDATGGQSHRDDRRTGSHRVHTHQQPSGGHGRVQSVGDLRDDADRKHLCGEVDEGGGRQYGHPPAPPARHSACASRNFRISEIHVRPSSGVKM